MRTVTDTVLYEAPNKPPGDYAPRSFHTPVEVGIYRVDPGTSTEHRDGHHRVTSEPTIYMPAGVVFHPHGLVTFRGSKYEVVGQTRQWGAKGNVATLRRDEG